MLWLILQQGNQINSNLILGLSKMKSYTFGFTLIFVVLTCILPYSAGLECYSCHFSNHTTPVNGTESCIKNPTNLIQCKTDPYEWCFDLEIKRQTTISVERGCNPGAPQEGIQMYCSSVNGISRCDCNFDTCNGPFIGSATMNGGNLPIYALVSAIILCFGYSSN